MVSLVLGAKKRKLTKNVTERQTAPLPCFLSREQLESMSDFDYADQDVSVGPPMPPSSRMTLEDTAQKVKRLQAEGNTLAEAGRFRAAIERWQQGLEYDPTNGILFELIAQACMETHDYFQGIQAATRATELRPTWSDGFATLAHCQFNYGELELAHASLSQALALEKVLTVAAALRAELDDMTALVDAHRRDLAAAAQIHFDDADAAQVHDCKTNLSRRSIAWTTSAVHGDLPPS
ncbi:Aste57867_14391 [Aphanomyces stellatus]|uniref:Aste57867_14391 protein n=1 Tax=Aphanomyces stellatus TaxID=120398 RepID=A0A485L1C4_9STRA|nr:hypothetical protein As57867_014337 [Aphanomyces stellatus]VFT91213.1 Aste57867_14391 [Aphanomyces stellatus]